MITHCHEIQTAERGAQGSHNLPTCLRHHLPHHFPLEKWNRLQILKHTARLHTAMLLYMQLVLHRMPLLHHAPHLLPSELCPNVISSENPLFPLIPVVFSHHCFNYWLYYFSTPLSSKGVLEVVSLCYL